MRGSLDLMNGIYGTEKHERTVEHIQIYKNKANL